MSSAVWWTSKKRRKYKQRVYKVKDFYTLCFFAAKVDFDTPFCYNLDKKNLLGMALPTHGIRRIT